MNLHITITAALLFTCLLSCEDNEPPKSEKKIRIKAPITLNQRMKLINAVADEAESHESHMADVIEETGFNFYTEIFTMYPDRNSEGQEDLLNDVAEITGEERVNLDSRYYFRVGDNLYFVDTEKKEGGNLEVLGIFPHDGKGFTLDSGLISLMDLLEAREQGTSASEVFDQVVKSRKAALNNSKEVTEKRLPTDSEWMMVSQNLMEIDIISENFADTTEILIDSVSDSFLSGALRESMLMRVWRFNFERTGNNLKIGTPISLEKDKSLGDELNSKPDWRPFPIPAIKRLEPESSHSSE